MNVRTLLANFVDRRFVIGSPNGADGVDRNGLTDGYPLLVKYG